MPRPPKVRRVERLPQVALFKPAGIPMVELEEVVLTVAELEALRLKDIEGLEQQECAERMQVSRTTFQRILTGARQKVARALVEGHALRIEGGVYQLAQRHFRCHNCGHTFKRPFGTGQRAYNMECPECGHRSVQRIHLD